ncbi:MAG: tyrosine-type recombinase/integrase [Desulfofustis sp. PB-SRB1]|nr:tyrosine-type recombinase/integrase [Desulfofustis sp. PB-SRB1]
MRTHAGYRNRIILEILYDTGIRAAEMAAVKTGDLDIVHGYLTIRSGKGTKDRVVPISSRVCDIIKQYLLMVRPAMSRGKETGVSGAQSLGNEDDTHRRLGPSLKGCPPSKDHQKCDHPYLPSHLCNSYAQERAPIRHIQEMLGHASLESTQIYTRSPSTTSKRSTPGIIRASLYKTSTWISGARGPLN